MEALYYTLDDFKDTRKKEFVAFRLEKWLFIELKRKAQQQNSDLSETIRGLCKQGLNYG